MALERQMLSLLRRGYRPVTAEQVLAGHGQIFHLTFDDAYRNLFSIVPVLGRLGIHTTIFACTAFASDGRALDVPEVAPRAAGDNSAIETMDWDALRNLAETGFEIGSHTVTHAHLTRLSDQELERELRESRGQIESELSRPCRFVAYPYGENDERVRRAAHAAGYTAGFSLRPTGSPDDLYGRPRIGIYRADGSLRFRLKTSRLYSVATASLDLVRDVRS
jgi:peptidoglycan/xylan/chitin deacetylase (PgdA/CDA1 family)